jgi:hypothetical protein
MKGKGCEGRIQSRSFLCSLRSFAAILDSLLTFAILAPLHETLIWSSNMRACTFPERTRPNRPLLTSKNARLPPNHSMPADQQ